MADLPDAQLAPALDRARLPLPVDALSRVRWPRDAAEWLYAAYLASLPVYCLTRLSGNIDAIWAATAITCAAWFTCSLAAARARVGFMRVVLLLLSGFGLALTFEYLGSRHGFLFGDYDYTDLLGYKALGEVPVIIPIAWFMMLYPSWQLAGKITARLRGLARPAARIAIGAAAMTAWDLSLDPRWVSDGAWVWHGGGLYFGIPLSNFAGWWVTAALIFCVWTLIDRAPWRSRDAALPTAVYATTWLGESVANVLFWGGPVIGAIVFVAMGVFVNSAYGNPTRRAVSRARMRNRRLRGGLQR